MTPTKLLAAATVTLTLLALGACGSDAGPDAGSDAGADGSAATTQPSATTPAPTAAPAPASSTASASPTAAPTTAAPAGKLIDYETDDESGATITTAADTSKLTGAPADFRAFIAAELKKNRNVDEGCTEPPQIYVSRVDTGGWARGGYFIPQCGGYASLWAKSGGTWKDVWGGQSLVECSTLEQYAFPARVAGASCLDGEDTVDYAG
jgi:hypothetical protein